ncbi:MAG: class F420-dependent enzyme [Acidimicrobiaceae bacterium]|nr:class F420-dependent enzyme [Acidimicrobiaceae bacterium]
MSIPDSHRDLLSSPVATLATIGPNGAPQQTVIWFLSDGDSVSISLNTDRQKVKNLRQRPQVSLLIVDFANPQRYLEIRGNTEISPDDDYAFARRVGQKYGADLKAYDRPGDTRVVVRIVETKVNAVDMGA